MDDIKTPSSAAKAASAADDAANRFVRTRARSLIKASTKRVRWPKTYIAA